MKNPAVVWESLPSIRTGVKSWSHTSKSALNFTIMDWTNFTLQDTNGYEQAFVQGQSGLLVHLWFAWLGAPSGNLKIYLKDAATPDHDQVVTDYFKAGKAPYQLWYNQDGCIWSAFPCLPFDAAFKAVITQRPDWYQYTLHRYREGRFSEVLTQEDVEGLRPRIVAPGGAFPGADPGNQAQSNTVDIGASQATVVFETRKAGVIRSIRITDEGRWTDQGSAFTVKINPDNDGVRLRKRINQMAYHQEVDVFVDGAPAGIWFEQGANYVLNYDHPPYRDLAKNYYAQKTEEVPGWQNGAMPSKFRDTEFEIPVALTKGKNTLRIKTVTRNSRAVKAADEKLTNEYYYWIYSYANVR
ncbi:MAG: hypothetical protein WCK89_18130 [bacterium]